MHALSDLRYLHGQGPCEHAGMRLLRAMAHLGAAWASDIYAYMGLRS